MIEYDNSFENGDIICDCCGHEENFEGSFHECIEKAKDDGWITKFKNGEYYFFCSDECFQNAKSRNII